jgi:hypothetical protein
LVFSNFSFKTSRVTRHEATADHKSSEETNDLSVGFQGALKK